MSNNKKLGLGLLITLGVGSMIGGGIFNSPTDLIGKANPQAALIAWGIGGIGVICLALVFQMLANKRPELKGGIYSYARNGFGEYIGFNSAWGYWIAAFLGNVSFFILLFKTINSLLGEGKELNPVISFIFGTLILWIIHLIITKGIKDAGVLNAIVTIAKLIPLALVIVLGLLIFNTATFFVDNWQTILAANGEITSLREQVESAMGTVLWCFVGVEAAVVLSERAQSQKLVGKATVIAVLITLAIYVLVSTLAMGIVDAKGLAEASTPLAEVLDKTYLGGTGGLIVKFGVITSVLGATLSWIMLTAEIPYVAARDGVMPRWFAKENKNGVPINSLIMSNAATQLFLLSLLSEKLQGTYYMVYNIATTTILIPYLFSALYSVKVCLQEKKISGGIIVSLIATVYAVYVIYAVGLLYLALTVIIFAVGALPYYFAKKEKGLKFTTAEMITAVTLILGALYLIYQIAIGKITL
jgi:arginine:ornithine antiporter / lysine permease